MSKPNRHIAQISNLLYRSASSLPGHRAALPLGLRRPSEKAES
jgi:hypothetical protein